METENIFMIRAKALFRRCSAGDYAEEGWIEEIAKLAQDAFVEGFYNGEGPYV